MRSKIRLLSLLLSVVVLMFSLGVNILATEAEAESETTVLLGDINDDGVIDTSDAQLSLQMAAGIISNDFTRADMDSDGYLTVRDAVAILRKALEPPAEEGGVVIPDKNGDNYLSDKADNEFIQLVVNKYGVDPDSLVAIYSVPDSGTNYVLQFKKSLIGSTYEKSPDNLQKVYHIGAAPDREISYTNGKLVLGDHYNCEAAEGVLVFNLVQTQVMPQYPDYFEGV